VDGERVEDLWMLGRNECGRLVGDFVGLTLAAQVGDLLAVAAAEGDDVGLTEDDFLGFAGKVPLDPDGPVAYTIHDSVD